MRPAGSRSLVRLLVRNRDYRLLLVAGLVSLTGDAVMLVGLTFLVYVLTGSTLASGLTLLASLLPQITLGSVAGVFVDRWDRRALGMLSRKEVNVLVRLVNTILADGT
jgi:Na+/melibiose symporter-like transporter